MFRVSKVTESKGSSPPRLIQDKLGFPETPGERFMVIGGAVC